MCERCDWCDGCGPTYQSGFEDGMKFAEGTVGMFVAMGEWAGQFSYRQCPCGCEDGPSYELGG